MNSWGKSYRFLSLLMLFSIFGCNTDDTNSKEVADQDIIGETFVLTGVEENNLIKKEINNLKLYSIDSNRHKVYYKEKVDYVVVNNKVKRTSNSSIPNFVDHSVVLNSDDSFTFSFSPRNPPLTIPFHVYADYNFSDTEALHGEFNNNFLSYELKEKLKSKGGLKIGAIGTSITAGAHTLEKFYFDSDQQSYPYLLAEAINTVKGNKVSVVNYSKGGGSIGYLETIIDVVLHDNIDLVLIEFGMNDHIHAWWESGLPSFELRISSAIEKFEAHNIDVILVGFFQQNPSWDLEFENSTIAYNHSLYNLAKKHNCYFADINKEFSKYSQTKINQDLCGDFMHHPTSFGHLLYYKTIIPVFLDKDVTDGFVYSLLN